MSSKNNYETMHGKNSMTAYLNFHSYATASESPKTLTSSLWKNFAEAIPNFLNPTIHNPIVQDLYSAHKLFFLVN